MYSQPAYFQAAPFVHTFVYISIEIDLVFFFVFLMQNLCRTVQKEAHSLSGFPLCVRSVFLYVDCGGESAEKTVMLYWHQRRPNMLNFYGEGLSTLTDEAVTL